MGGQHAMGGHATRGQAIGHYARGGQGTRAGGDYYQGGAPIYDYYQGGGDYYQDGAPTYEYQGGGGPSCDTYYGNGCPGYGVPFVGGLINGVLGGYDPY
jgi:hypothetical protein